MEKISITTQLSERDYIMVNYYMLYRKFWAVFLTIIGLAMLLIIAYYYLTNPIYFETFPLFQFFFGVYATLGMPLFTYVVAKKNYKDNPRMTESIRYSFDQEFIELIGESFESKLTWNKIHSVTESKHWILVWQNSKVANVLPKKYFTDETLSQFKTLVKSIQGLKNKLKD